MRLKIYYYNSMFPKACNYMLTNTSINDSSADIMSFLNSPHIQFSTLLLLPVCMSTYYLLLTLSKL